MSLQRFCSVHLHLMNQELRMCLCHPTTRKEGWGERRRRRGEGVREGGNKDVSLHSSYALIKQNISWQTKGLQSKHRQPRGQHNYYGRNLGPSREGFLNSKIFEHVHSKCKSKRSGPTIQDSPYIKYKSKCHNKQGRLESTQSDHQFSIMHLFT